ncbi:MAG: AzlD domain-containing protein [Gammaproteobacteria bacterium]|nr:AzlD domain-containing protein [Gammaproteobacteria bacterium]
MRSGLDIWVIILAVGVGTFLLRISLIAMLGRARSVPPALQRALRFIPPAVLAAIATPSLVQVDGVLTAGPRLLAGLVAILVAWKTKNVLATIIVGLVTLWVIQAL